jgi:probable addiction module antidote protein
MRSYRELVTQTVQDPGEASAYLKASLDDYEQDGNLEAFLLALRTVIEAQGGMTELARKTSLNRQNLYRTLSKNGNPRLQTLHEILHAIGLKLSIEPRSSEKTRSGHTLWVHKQRKETERPLTKGSS